MFSKHHRRHNKQVVSSGRCLRVLRVSCTLLAILSLAAFAAVFVNPFGGGASAAALPASGVDCGCTKVGDYQDPKKGVLPAMHPDGTPTSPLKTYVVSQQVIGSDPKQTTIQITVKKVSGGATVLSTEVPGPGNVRFGFSKDDKRFVLRFKGVGMHHVRLYKMDVAAGQQALSLHEFSYNDTNSIVHFSPNAKYLFY